MAIVETTALLTTIATGLGLVDKFYDLTRKMMGKTPTQHSVQVSPGDRALIVSAAGHKVEIAASQLKLEEFDELRHNTLLKKIKLNWQQYNDIDLSIVTAAPDEKARLRLQMEAIRQPLCKDFRELVQIYEGVLGLHLPDHYTLHGVCN